jgi:hypothetical protein
MPPGSTFVYYTGSLANDLHDNGNRELRVLATLVLEAAWRGEICLTQKRIDWDRYEYRATLTRPEFKPRPRPVRRLLHTWHQHQAYS